MESVTVTLPNRPVITVHKGWTPSGKQGNNVKPAHAVDQPSFETHTFSVFSGRGRSGAAKPPKEEAPLTSHIVPATRLREIGQRFNFINNAYEPLRIKDAATRKLVRSHAMLEVARERRERKRRLKDRVTEYKRSRVVKQAPLPSERPTEHLPVNSVEAMLCVRTQSSSRASLNLDVDRCFTDYLTRIQANIGRLATVYFSQLGSAIFPMEFHSAYNPPTQLSTLDSSFTDSAVFQSCSYAAAVCSNLADGRRNNNDITLQMSMTIGLVNRLLEGGVVMADGLLGAVSHLAMGEALRGNFNDWAVHMTGLKKMVEMRGGMNQIHFYLQMKLFR